MGAFLRELNWQIARQDRIPENRDQLDRITNLHDRVQEEFYNEEGEDLVLKTLQRIKEMQHV